MNQGNIMMSEQKIERMTKKGQRFIKSYSSKALKASFVPFISVPIIHGICVKLTSELNRIFGIKTTKSFGGEAFTNTVVGLIATPFMLIPLAGAFFAIAYVESIGEAYLDALTEVAKQSTEEELKDEKLMAQRIIKTLKSQRRA